MANGTFNPSGNVTRGQFVTFLWRLGQGDFHLHYMQIPFTDVPANHFSRPPVGWAHHNNVVTGLNATTFAPNANITREQLVVMLFRAYGNPFAENRLNNFADGNQVSSWAREAMNWAIVQGMIGVGSTRLNPQGNASRAESVAMLYRMVDRLNIRNDVNPMAVGTNRNVIGILNEVNRQRSLVNALPVELQPLLNHAAQIRAEEISRVWGHTRPCGREAGSIFMDMGYVRSIGGEIITGSLNPVNSFMNSPPHRRAMLTPDGHYIGIGMFGNYTVIFISDREIFNSRSTLSPW